MTGQVSRESRIATFMIVDTKRKKVVSEADLERRTYEFFNKTLEQEFQSGIVLLPGDRGEFGGRAKVKSPDKDTEVTFELFLQLIRSHSEKLKKDGFQVIEIKYL